MTAPSARLRGGPHAAVWVLPSRFDAVLFDLDGVLTDTARLHLAAWREMFAELEPAGPPLSDEEYRAHIDGGPARRGCVRFSTHAGSVSRTTRCVTWRLARTRASGPCWMSEDRT